MNENNSPVGDFLKNGYYFNFEIKLVDKESSCTPHIQLHKEIQHSSLKFLEIDN